MQKLIIFLEPQYDAPNWVVMDDKSQIRAPLENETLSSIAEDSEVIVVVPAQDVLLSTAHLPKMSRSKLLQALPFAIEEQLIDEIDTLHFAADDNHTQSPLPIAIVAKEKIQHWLDTLRQLRVQPDKIVSAVALLPSIEETWSVLLKDDLAIVRTVGLQGFACDRANLPSMLSMAIKSVEQPPKALYFYNYTIEPCETTLELRSEVKEEILPSQQFYIDAARHVLKETAINLLQGPFAIKKTRLPQKQKILKLTAVVGIGCVFLFFLYPIVSHFILKQRIDQIDQAIAVIYKRNFPQSANMVAPKRRMEEKLRKLSSQIGDNRFLQLLAFLGKSIREIPEIKLEHLDFQNNQLTLEILASSSDDFSRFTESLQGQGLSVKQQNANLSGSRITASLLIE